MAPILFLVGRPGVGKTTVIRAAAQVLGERAGGFYTQEIRDGGKRQGFELVGLSGERATLAHVRFREVGQPRVGRYGVDVAALERVGVAALKRATAQGLIVIIDEIGKMELFSQSFKKGVLDAIDGRVPVIATVMARSDVWVDRLKARAEVTSWQVTLENRDALPSRVLEWVAREA